MDEPIINGYGLGAEEAIIHAQLVAFDVRAKAIAQMIELEEMLESNKWSYQTKQRMETLLGECAFEVVRANRRIDRVLNLQIKKGKMN